VNLATRIAAYDWLLVGLLVAVSALGMKLVGSLGEQAATVIRAEGAHADAARRMESALYAHELASARVQLGHGRPEEIYEARSALRRALDAATEAGLATTQLEPIERVTDRYFTGQESLDRALDAVRVLRAELAEEIEAEAELATDHSESGVRLMASAGAVALLLAILLAARSTRRITHPLEALRSTLVALTEQRASGRRVPDGDYDQDLREVARAVNVLAERTEQAEQEPDLDRRLMTAAVERVLERLETPTVLVDLSGCVRLSNAPARQLLASHTPHELQIPQHVQSALSGAADERWERLVGARGSPVGFLVRVSSPETV